MNYEDMLSLSQKTREDGKRLFNVCEFLYKSAIFSIILFAIIGVIGSLYMLTFSPIAAIFIALGVAAICFTMYMMAVLMTHVGKVLVHTSFSSIGILEKLSDSKINGDSK